MLSGGAMENTEVILNENNDIEDGSLMITLKKPINFEGTQYTKIDLNGLENITATDMVEVNRLLNRRGNVDFLQEMTLEYALNLAARASGLPVEFFMQLSPWAAMQVKNRVTGFLYRQE